MQQNKKESLINRLTSNKILLTGLAGLTLVNTALVTLSLVLLFSAPRSQKIAHIDLEKIYKSIEVETESKTMELLKDKIKGLEEKQSELKKMKERLDRKKKGRGREKKQEEYDAFSKQFEEQIVEFQKEYKSLLNKGSRERINNLSSAVKELRKKKGYALIITDWGHNVPGAVLASSDDYDETIAVLKKMGLKEVNPKK